MKVAVDVPEPGAAIVFLLKLTVTPEGWPEADKAIDELKLPVAAVVMVEVPLLPSATESEVGEAPIVKFAGPVTVRLTVVVCVTLPPIPVTVIG